MSQERRERQKERLGDKTSNQKWGRIFVYALLIAAAFGLAYYLGHRSQHQHDSFARCLSQRGVKMYGAYWCPHCSDQKALFNASFKYVNYIECGLPGTTSQLQQVCTDAGIKHFPTWQFPPMGERVEGEIPLGDLSLRTGCPLP